MTSFFDWCDRHKRLFFILLFAAIVLCFIFPLCDYAVKDSQGKIVDIIKLPFIYVIFIYEVKAFNVVVVILLALSLLFCVLFGIFPGKKISSVAIPLSLALVGTLVCPITKATDEAFYARIPSFDWNSIVLLILFALYVLYLLLRRFYAPAKARVVASVERRKASRKPTKDERIAELEKRVAELESKDEHQKSTPS